MSELSKKRRRTRAFLWFNTLVIQTFGRFLRWRYKIRTENLESLKTLPQPWLVLPNHVMFWDPVLVALFIRQPVYFIASDANFRNRFFSFWLRMVGAIPTSKKATDMTTLKQMMTKLREGKTVGLFPEGERTWHGSTMPIIEATGKLVRIANVSVVTPIIKGGYQSQPRWTYKSRRGPVTIDFRIALKKEELRGMSVSDINARIQQSIEHDDFSYQSRQKKPYITPAPAEPLQLLLFTCPHCRKMNSMYSRIDRVYCRSCGWETKFSSFGYFRAVGDHTHHFTSIGEWATWQHENLTEVLDRQLVQSSNTVLFSDSECEYLTGYKFRSLRHRGKGTLSLSCTGLKFTFDGDSSKSRDFLWKDISALNMVYQSQVEFYHDARLQVFKFPGKDVSGYKYLASGRIIQDRMSTILSEQEKQE